jgi:hypothetical protein
MHLPAAKRESSLALENPAYKAVFAKIDRRLLPLLLIAYIVAYLDRIRAREIDRLYNQLLANSERVHNGHPAPGR